ncbi:glycosyltransferase [Mammaliicoccus sciuri]|uniref:glycosyltransferase n=1 Tax=Mammaliicoccus sciuri TaxID=1296 RepID=UPI002B25740E|nr:glycosyltransferase [Mammaliicoccus sciuri]MEB6262257.1 glycosyltransferase [Mammaliicoccus sciuri]WQK57559.1 glycosyltransferase [Mammaliicoccus sciuri]
MNKDTNFPLISSDFNNNNKQEKYNYIMNIIDEKFNASLDFIDFSLNESNILNYYQQVEEKSKLNFLAKHYKDINNLPNSNGSAIFKKSPYKIGIISDLFLYNSFKDVCDLNYISSDSFDLNIKYDFVIIASTWKGIDNSWVGFANPNSDKRKKLLEVINIFKSESIPVIFYSKEDPVNFDIFKDIAKVCDVIFTSAEEIKTEYMEYCENNKVYTLQFGVNPHYHNPVGTNTIPYFEKKNEVIFAGSWTKKYPERNFDLKMLLDGIIMADKELTIIDRNLELKNERYQFPVDFIQFLAPPVSHDVLMELHKIYRWAVNVNSVKYSNTMFANRVFELQAFGNLLLSNYSMGINNQFSNVFLVNVEEDAQLILNNYDEQTLLDIQSKSIRNVMRNNTTYHRLDEIAQTINLDKTQKDPTILVITNNISDDILTSFERQLNVNAELKSVNEIIDVNNYDFVTFMDKNIDYEEYYLEDLLTAFKYTDVDFVTKNNKMLAHHYTKDFNDKYKTMFKSRVLDKNLNIQDDILGYVLNETEIFKHQYTNNEKPELSIIIPIYNNGEYLEEKCFKSLLRSSIFKKMEIIFVNDGSNDNKTKYIIDRLIRRHPHIINYNFDSGSGSASRPRNKGVELATTDYITYLDPDNEATGDGYKRLFERIQKDKSLDMVVGNIIKEDNESRKVFRFSSTVKKYNNNNNLITNTKKFLKNSGLRSQSIQALIVKKSIIKNNSLNMIEGAAGQDTLFFHQLLLFSKKCLALDEYVHVYYASVDGSVTNSISKNLFEKYLKIEKERVPFLVNNNLISSYMENKFNFYFKNWYIPRLKKVKHDEYHEAIKIFLEIYNMYESFKRPTDELLEQEILVLRETIE